VGVSMVCGPWVNRCELLRWRQWDTLDDGESPCIVHNPAGHCPIMLWCKMVIVTMAVACTHRIQMQPTRHQSQKVSRSG
jgi:hypothetical protein